MLGFRNFEIHKICVEVPMIFLCFSLSVLGSPEISNIGFGARGHVQKSQNHRSEEFGSSHIHKSKSKTKSMQNNSTELLSLSFP